MVEPWGGRDVACVKAGKGIPMLRHLYARSGETVRRLSYNNRGSDH